MNPQYYNTMILPVLTGKGRLRENTHFRRNSSCIKSCLSGVTVVVCICYQYVFTWYLPQRYMTDCHSVLCWSVVNAVDSAQGVYHLPEPYIQVQGM